MGSGGRWFATALGTILGGLVILCIVLFFLSRKDYTDDYRKRAGGLSNATLEEISVDGSLRRHWLHLTSTSGLTVNCGMLTPGSGGRRYPAIVVLGGKATGKHAVDYALGVDNVILVSPDYPYEPRDEYTFLQIAGDVPAVRRAMLDMVPSVMLVTEYLWKRPDVDTTRLILMGYSFGAPFIPAIVAQDRRAAMAILVYGGGDVASLIRHNVRRFEGDLIGSFSGWLGGLLLRPLEPLRFIDRVSPIPLLMINGTDDEQVPRGNAQLLFDSAREPKKIIWLDSRHVHPRNVELTRRIIETIALELRQRGMLDPLPSR